uniref:YbaN family protein n=1 Tax=Agathobacter sp. TaxID=2021311 RepID=UPI0040577075
MKVKKFLYIIVGCIGVGLGAIGAVVPMIPAFPFLLLTAYCFGRSSERLNNWFINTKLYKDNLETYVQGKGMTWKTKIRIMVTVTLLMSIGFLMMSRVPVGRVVLACVWTFHIVYFIFGVKTLE